MPLPRLSFTAFRSVVCAATVGLAGCATRTVYVVDDDHVTQPAPAQPALVGAPPPLAADPMTAGPSFADTDFVEPLSPYGSWMSYPGYGMVFIPDATIVGRNFRPYTNGHWEYTEWGWTWVDHHPFGWATGHYGRWFFDARYGWIWVPGSQWAPAWVSWRTGGGYIGWAAMPPGSVVGGGYGVYDTSWVFVTTGNFGAPQVGAVLIWGSSYRSCYAQTQPARGTVVVGGRPVYGGPNEREVSRDTRVIHRPLAETDRDQPVTPPPSVRTRRRDRDPSGDGAVADTGRDRDPGVVVTDRDDGAARDRDDGTVTDGLPRADPPRRAPPRIEPPTAIDPGLPRRDGADDDQRDDNTDDTARRPVVVRPDDADSPLTGGLRGVREAPPKKTYLDDPAVFPSHTPAVARALETPAAAEAPPTSPRPDTTTPWSSDRSRTTLPSRTWPPPSVAPSVQPPPRAPTSPSPSPSRPVLGPTVSPRSAPRLVPEATGGLTRPAAPARIESRGMPSTTSTRLQPSRPSPSPTSSPASTSSPTKSKAPTKAPTKTPSKAKPR